MPVKIKFSAAGKVLFKGTKLACTCCCPTTAPTAQSDSVGKSRSKCGHGEYYPHVSTPPKKYRLMTAAGSSSHTVDGLAVGSQLYHTGTITVSGTHNACTGVNTIESTTSRSGNRFCFGPDPYSETTVSPGIACGPIFDGGGSQTEVLTATTRSLSWTAPSANLYYCSGLFGPIPQSGSGSATETLSDEFTDEQLEAEVDAAIDAEGFDGDWDDAEGSYFNRSADGLSLSKRKGRKRWAVSGFGLTVGRTYRIKYIPRFTPLVGAVVDSAETYLEFTFTEGMTHTEHIDIPVPTTNGTNTLVYTGWECPPAA